MGAYACNEPYRLLLRNLQIVDPTLLVSFNGKEPTAGDQARTAFGIRDLVEDPKNAGRLTEKTPEKHMFHRCRNILNSGAEEP